MAVRLRAQAFDEHGNGNRNEIVEECKRVAKKKAELRKCAHSHGDAETTPRGCAGGQKMKGFDV